MISIPLLVVFAGLARAAVNGACSANGTPGVCLVNTDCTSGGGTTHSGFCPNDPSNVLCCTKTSCGSGGNCRFTSACASGNTASGMCFLPLLYETTFVLISLPQGLCPGPSDFKCCLPSAACAPPAVNAATVSLIKEFEGFVASPSPDPIGLPTVGYGHLCQQANCAEVPFSFPMTEAQAATLLQTDLKTYTKCLSDAIVDSVRLNANQYGALSSWTFNEGCGNMRSSTLISRLNNGENPNTVAAQELPKWTFAGGVSLPGLVRRRAAEVVLFQTASSVISHPPPC
ncbi:glycoside hydrolase family 24 protein [Collybia nuda]|uniref:Glycoside hydrolase family 24 protein n=1 Tax=Collybia nuda TaxID=64659 RepID=A0A9P6CHA1_9AGAR|nr:glycoside hydrolase family 24 protein [Collybia nuda]